MTAAGKQFAQAHCSDTGLLCGYLGEAGSYVHGSPTSATLLGDLARQTPPKTPAFHYSDTTEKPHG